MAKSLLDYIAEEDKQDYLDIIERATENKKNAPKAPRAPRKVDPAKKISKMYDKKAKLEAMIAAAEEKLANGEATSILDAINLD